MLRFQPEEMLRALGRHQVRYAVIGGVGATLHGSPLPTRDADICPSPDESNLERLAAALREMNARIRAPDVPAGLPFACDAAFLRQRTARRTAKPRPPCAYCSSSAARSHRSRLERRL